MDENTELTVENENLETEENKEVAEETVKDETQTFTKQELADFVKQQIAEAKKAENEARKKAEEDAKLTEKQRNERDFKEAQMKLKIDRFDFDIEQYKASLDLKNDEILNKILQVDFFINNENCLEDAKNFVDNYKTALDAAYAKGKKEAENEFNKIKMQGQEVFEGLEQQKINKKVNNFDDFYNSLFNE